MNFNPFDLMKNAQNIKEQFEKAQSELAVITATGSSGGGIVKVTINGNLRMVSIQLDPIAVDPRDISMLQDLIVSATNDAHSKVTDIIKEKLGPLASGMQIPGFTQ